MMTLMFILALDQLVFKDVVRYKATEAIGIPEAVAFDRAGKLWLTDADGNLFVWNDQGQLLYELGGEGEGPGEFNISNQSLLITSDKEKMIVCDTHKVSYFSLDGRFLRSDFKPPEMQRRCLAFFRTPSGYLVAYNHYDGDREQGKLMTRIVLTDENLSEQKLIREDRDWMWSKTPSNGWHYQPYAPRSELAFSGKTIFLAQSNDITVTAFNLKGTQLYDFKVKLPISKILKEDIDDYRIYFRSIKQSPNDKISFPEDDSRIDFLIPLPNNLMVVYQYKSIAGLLKGTVVDAKNGSVKAKFSADLGSQGRLLAERGKVIMTRFPDVGAFDIKRVTPIFVKADSEGAQDAQR